MLCAQLERGGSPRRRHAQRRAVVIGGGLAGSAAADSLAQRGWEIALVERHDRLAAEASGNPQGVLYARLSAHGTPLSRLVQDGYQYTLRLLAGPNQSGPVVYETSGDFVGGNFQIHPANSGHPYQGGNLPPWVSP